LCGEAGPVVEVATRDDSEEGRRDWAESAAMEEGSEVGLGFAGLDNSIGTVSPGFCAGLCVWLGQWTGVQVKKTWTPNLHTVVSLPETPVA
jgi:hypothetical protein